MTRPLTALIATLAITATLAGVPGPAAAWSWGETQGVSGRTGSERGSGIQDVSGMDLGSGR